MHDQSQNDLIKERLERGEVVSRNWALSNYIGRLASRINDLKNSGLDIIGYPVSYINAAGRKCRDYEYILRREPQQATLL